MTKPQITFINQSPNQMLGDIAMVYLDKGYECTLISGTEPENNAGFHRIIQFTAYNRKSVFSRLITWIQFTVKTLSWLRNNSPDEIFLVSNPPFNLYLPWLVKKTRNKKIKMLVYDLYPDILKKSGRKASIPVAIMSWLNKKSFRYASVLYVPSESLKLLVAQYTSQPVKTVYNWVDVETIPALKNRENKFLVLHDIADKFIVLYSGNLGRTHDVETILYAAGMLKNYTHILFLFIGEGEGMKQVKQALAIGAENIRCFDWQDQDMFRHSISCGNVAWVSYKKGFEEYSIPSKLPFLLASATPVIMIGNPDSELAEILVKNEIGFSIDNNDAESLSGLLIKLAEEKNNDMGLQARSYAKQHFSIHNSGEFI